jgi:hypothetical protein
MPFSFANRGTVAIVRWGVPIMSDVEACLDQVRERHRQVGPLVLVLLVPEAGPAPSANVTAAMVHRFPELSDYSRAMFQVIEGTGFSSGFKRSVVTGMLLAANKVAPKHKRVQLTVLGTLEEVATHVPPADRRDLLALAAEARSDEPVRPPLNRPALRAVTGG